MIMLLKILLCLLLSSVTVGSQLTECDRVLIDGLPAAYWMIQVANSSSDWSNSTLNEEGSDWRTERTNGSAVLWLENDDEDGVKPKAEYHVPVLQNISITFSGLNLTEGVMLRLESNWDKITFVRDDLEPDMTAYDSATDRPDAGRNSSYTFYIKGSSEESLLISGLYPYIYEVDIFCLPINNQSEETKIAEFSLVVRKNAVDSSLTRTFSIATNVFLVFAMFLMGTDLDFDMVVSYIKRPLVPLLGMSCQFIGMPLLSYGIGYGLLREEPYARLGLLLVGCSPGGSVSNFWTVLFKGDANLSVTMTLCSTIISFGLTTFWIWVLGSNILDSGQVSIPYVPMILSLLSLVIPLCIGILLNKFKPKIGSRLQKLNRPVFFLFIIFAVTVGLYANRFIFLLVGWHHIISGFLLGFSGGLLGIILAKLFRLKNPQIVAVALETAFQNPGVSVVVLQSNLPSPYSDIGLLPVMGFVLTVMGPTMLSIYFLWQIYVFIRERCCSSMVVEKDSELTEKKPNSSNERHTNQGSQNLAFEGDVL